MYKKCTIYFEFGLVERGRGAQSELTRGCSGAYPRRNLWQGVAHDPHGLGLA